MKIYTANTFPKINTKNTKQKEYFFEKFRVEHNVISQSEFVKMGYYFYLPLQ
jgi:hypothetical protein